MYYFPTYGSEFLQLCFLMLYRVITSLLSSILSEFETSDINRVPFCFSHWVVLDGSGIHYLDSYSFVSVIKYQLDLQTHHRDQWYVYCDMDFLLISNLFILFPIIQSKWISCSLNFLIILLDLILSIRFPGRLHLLFNFLAFCWSLCFLCDSYFILFPSLP